MPKFTPATRHNQCPICSDASGDCRHGEKVILCHTFIDSDAELAGYKYLHPTKNGLWGVYVPIENVETPHIASQHADEAKLKRRQKEWIELNRREKAQRHSQALPIPERDKAIRQLHKYIGLSSRHRQHLKEVRGLADHRIDAGYYFSIAPYQEIPAGIPLNLPGVDLTGRKLWTKDAGIAIPAVNSRDQLIGWQVRLDNPPADGGRYRWAGGGDNSSHLPNGELPITFCRPERLERKNPGLAEGFLKARIAADKLSQIIIGAAGGQFTSSPEQIELELCFAVAETLSNTIDIFPDAGDIANRHVMRRWEKTINLVRSWGYDVQVAWWEQRTKEDSDIDELENTSAIAYITPEEFYSISVLRENEVDDCPDTEPDPEEYAAYSRFTEELEEQEEAEEQERARQKKLEYEQKVIETQKRLNTLTYPVDILLDSEYLPLELVQQLPHSGIINLKARKGGGKSTLLRRLIALWKSENRPIISITPRIALGREQAFKWDITWIDDCGVVKNYSITRSMQEEEKALGLCWDSFWKIARRDWENAVIIIDEAELGLAHVATSSTCEDKRAFILKGFAETLQETLRTGGLVVLSDADLTNIPCDYIKAFVPEAPVFTVVNTHKGTPWDVEFFSGKRDELESRILDNLEMGLKTAVATDSQAEAEALERTVLKHYPDARIVRIDRKTCEQDFGREFVKDPNKGIRDTQPDLLIYTPSMGVGVSIEEEWFDEVIGMFFGALEPSQDRQMLARIRSPIPRIVWCTPARHDIPGCKSPLPEVIKRQMMNFHKTTSINLIDLAKQLASSPNDEQILAALNSLWDPVTKSWNSPHIDLYAKLKARRNYGLSQLSVQLYQELLEEGHDIICYEGVDTAINDEITDAKEEILQQTAVALSHSESVSLETAKAIQRSPNATEADRLKARKAFLRDALPDVELTAQFVYKAVIGDRGRWLAAVRLYWMMLNPEKTKILDTRTWRHHLEKCMVYLPDIRTYSLQVKVLRDLDISRYIDPNREYCHKHSDIQQFMARAYELRHRISTAFNFTVTKDTDPIKFLDKLMERIGLGLELTRRTREGDERIRYYRLAGLDDPDRVAVLEALDQKYETLNVGQNNPVNINNSAVVAQADLIENQQEIPASTEVEATSPPTPVVSYLGKLYRLVRLSGATAFLMEMGNANPLGWFRQMFGCDRMVQSSQIIWQT